MFVTLYSEKQHPFYELINEFVVQFSRDHAIHEAAWVSSGSAVEEAREFRGSIFVFV